MTFRGMRAALAAVVLVAVAGCSAEPAPVAKPTLRTIPTPTASKPAPVQPPFNSEPNSRCIPVSAAMLEYIASGEKEPGGMVPVLGAAVKSNDFDNLYMIGVQFKSKGMQAPLIATFASPTLEPGGELFTVDGAASIFTGWPDGGSSQFQILLYNEGVRIAMGCAGVSPPAT